MSEGWQEISTTTHQDHVIAHVLGAKILAYFTYDETLYLVLDMGFIWIIYLDCQMVLLPGSVGFREIDVDAQIKATLLEELDRVYSGEALSLLTPLRSECVLREARIMAREEERRLLLLSDEGGWEVLTSLREGKITVTERTGQL
jgi:hypothetical protein